MYKTYFRISPTVKTMKQYIPLDSIDIKSEHIKAYNHSKLSDNILSHVIM